MKKVSIKEIYRRADRMATRLAAKHAYQVSRFFNSLGVAFSYGLLRTPVKD